MGEEFEFILLDLLVARLLLKMRIVHEELLVSHNTYNGLIITYKL